MSVTEQKTASRTQLLCCFHTERMTSAKQKANVAAGEATAGVAIEDLNSQPNCGFAHKLSIRPHKQTCAARFPGAKNVLGMPSSQFWTSRACFEPSRRRRGSIGQHVKELVLTPGKRDGEEVYEVSGEWELRREKKCVIFLVARDGIEPPTPAFSGLRSTS